AGLDEEPGGTLAQALDVEAAAAGEVRDAPHELGGALERVRADRVRALAHERRAAARALAGHRERGAALVAGVDALHDLGDHVAGALDPHVVALADVLAHDVLHVVEVRAADRDPADV